jgi:hypothetical protein
MKNLHGALSVILLPLIFSACATLHNGSISREATVDDYTKFRDTKGVVILAVDWGRQWGCASSQNAEILSMGFDRLPPNGNANDQPSEIFLDGPPRLTKTRGYVDYALFLEPGEYALSSFDIKVALSSSDIRHFLAGRKNLIQEGQAKAGSFQVGAGETIYIGHFFLDCLQQPMLWRYYADGREAFHKHMSRVKQKYPFVDTDKAIYRLFKTPLGLPYELPD